MRARRRSTAGFNDLLVDDGIATAGGTNVSSNDDTNVIRTMENRARSRPPGDRPL